MTAKDFICCKLLRKKAIQSSGAPIRIYVFFGPSTPLGDFSLFQSKKNEDVWNGRRKRHSQLFWMKTEFYAKYFFFFFPNSRILTCKEHLALILLMQKSTWWWNPQTVSFDGARKSERRGKFLRISSPHMHTTLTLRHRHSFIYQK